MRNITEEELKEILEQHKLWLDSDEKEGKRANLTFANLCGANLTDTNLTDVDLTGANLRYADLRYADLTRVDLYGADLTNASLTDAVLTDADLSGANLTDTILDEKEQCRKGIVLNEPMVGYKELDSEIIILEIPVGAKVFSINNNRRRTNKAKVIDIQGETELSSMHDASFKYHVGDEIEITNFDERYNVECSTGIHFFLTRDEAEKYVY